jgi:hypothetical protein
MNPCDALDCDRGDTGRYLNGTYCPAHTPAATAGHPEPGRTAGDGGWINRTWHTPTYAKGATDINKERPGGYMSRQRAVKIAAAKDAERARNAT